MPARSRRRRAVRAALWAAALLGLAPTALALFYHFVPPVSTPMLAHWLTGREVARDWVPLEEMSPQIVRAVVMSEDGQYCRHRGVDWGALRTLLRQDGPPARGGSTITMQTARNLFLWRGRSYVRKGLEIPLALLIDRLIGKRRVMEIYLNIAEWGDGAFGVQAGARAQLRRDARDLTAGEAALMAAVLPNPIAFDAGRPGPRTRGVARTVQRRMGGADPWVDCLT